MPNMEGNYTENIKYFTGSECRHKLCALSRNLTVNSKSHQRSLSEIKYYLSRYKINKFEFVDFLNLNPEELNKFCNAVVENKLSIEWSAPLIVDSAMTFDNVIKMKQAGCRKLIFELFSGSDNLLSKIGAVFTANDASVVLKACHKAGIAVGINLVFGHPLETEDDRDKTIDFLQENVDFIDEITSVIPCSGVFSYVYPSFADCRYREQCCKPGGMYPAASFAADFSGFISKIHCLNKPVIYIYPAETVFDEFEEHTLRNKNLCFYFDKGKGNIFWKGLKLTSGLGLYASIFADGFWQDSEHAHWQVDKISKEKMVLKGKWQWLPLIQLWEIELKETVITIKIEMEFIQRISIEGEQQVNIMLRSEYGQWFSGSGVSGSFSPLFDDNWPAFFEKVSEAAAIVEAEAVAQEEFPFVSLSDRVKSEGNRMAVLNSSSVFNSRILKYYRVDNKSYLPGKYPYFDGEIKIKV